MVGCKDAQMPSLPCQNNDLATIQGIVRKEFEEFLSGRLLGCPIAFGTAAAGNSERPCDGNNYTPNQSPANDQPSLPQADRLRSEIRKRQARGKFFDPSLFGEPVWDMLMELALNEVEGKKVSVSSLCIASGVPNSTALRWVNVLCSKGLCEREDDQDDRRRTYICLSSKGRNSLTKYFSLFPL